MKCITEKQRQRIVWSLITSKDHEEPYHVLTWISKEKLHRAEAITLDYILR